MKELIEKIKSDKTYRNKFIAIAVSCVVVIAVAIIVPVCVHNSKVEKEAIASENTTSVFGAEIILTTTPGMELSTEATTSAEEFAAAQAAGNGSGETPVAPTQSVTKAQTTKAPATKSSTTKTSTTKAATTKAPATTDAEAAAKAKLPPALANSNGSATAKQKLSAYEEDAETAANGSPLGNCHDCGKLRGHGTHGTCVKFTRDCNCPTCGAWVEKGACHTCQY